MRKNPPDLCVLIDFPEFNLRLARAAKRAGVPVLYYIDIEVIDNGVPYTILYDTIRPFQPVTKSVT